MCGYHTPSIIKLLNLSLAERVFSSKIKKAVITSFIKKASLSSEDLKNYHPVSGPCFMSNLVQQVVVKKIMQHINSNNLSLSHGEPTALFFLDLSAAFNTIHHTTLLNCLKSWLGVCRMALKWFTSYLSHQFQAIKPGSTLSEL